MTDNKLQKYEGRAAGEAGLVLSSYEQMSVFAEAAVRAGLGPKAPREVAHAMAIMQIQMGAEIGLGPMASIMGLSVINGKPGMNAGLMAARIQGSGRFRYIIKHLTNKRCLLHLLDAASGKVIGESDFTLKDAQDAELTTGKNAHTWRKYPRNMLFARALSNLARWYCPEVFGGSIYVPEELSAQAVVEAVVDEVAEEEVSIPEYPEHVYGKVGDRGHTLTEGQANRLRELIFDDRLNHETRAWLAKAWGRLHATDESDDPRTEARRIILRAKKKAAGTAEDYDAEVKQRRADEQPPEPEEQPEPAAEPEPPPVEDPEPGIDLPEAGEREPGQEG